MYDGAMLKEVYCELFKSTAGPRGRIQFHQGLNTVLGGEAADNSIGKSTSCLSWITALAVKRMGRLM